MGVGGVAYVATVVRLTACMCMHALESGACHLAMRNRSRMGVVFMDQALAKLVVGGWSIL